MALKASSVFVCLIETFVSDMPFVSVLVSRQFLLAWADNQVERVHAFLPCIERHQGTEFALTPTRVVAIPDFLDGALPISIPAATRPECGNHKTAVTNVSRVSAIVIRQLKRLVFDARRKRIEHGKRMRLRKDPQRLADVIVVAHVTPFLP
jgi:hypothetical protein